MVCMRIKNMLPVTSVNLRLKFGVPQSVSNISQHLDSSEQTATLEKTDSTILWKLKSLAPHAESVAQFRLISQSDALNREDVGPLRMEFEISGHLLSGMKIKTVKIVNQEQTTPQKWLRYITVMIHFLSNLCSQENEEKIKVYKKKCAIYFYYSLLKLPLLLQCVQFVFVIDTCDLNLLIIPNV
ncbi:uncharacterized protein LOC134236351 [Saccostrea cucullata]|uniref:uncharacterized protein LOC134236351 n=1 Tax=Saccostrea cuccullata TaxID=36930 RepID=UPI002ED25CF7